MRPPTRDLTVVAVLVAMLAMGAVTGAAQVAGGAPVIGKKCTKAGVHATTIKGVPVTCSKQGGKFVWAKRSASTANAAAGPPAAGKSCAPAGSTATTFTGEPLVCTANKGKLVWAPKAAAAVQPASGAQAGGATSNGAAGATPTGLGSGPLESVPGRTGAPGLASGVGVIADAGRVAIQLSSGVPQGVAVDSATGIVYVGASSGVGDWCELKFTGPRADRLSIVDPDATRETASVSAGGSPIWPTVFGGRVWLAESGGRALASYTLGGERLSVLPVGGAPHDVAGDSASGLLFVTNTNDSSQSWIAVVRASDGSLVRHVPVERFPHRIHVNSELHRAWIVSVETGTINVIDSATGQALGRWETGGGAGLGYSRKRGLLYVSERESGLTPTQSVRVVDASTGAAAGTIGPFFNRAGNPPQKMAVDDDRDLLYVALNDSRYVGVADLRTLKPLAVFRAADCPFAIVLDAARGRGFVTSGHNAEVVMFDLTKIARALGR